MFLVNTDKDFVAHSYRMTVGHVKLNSRFKFVILA